MDPGIRFHNRIQKIMEILPLKGYDAFLISNRDNIRYLSGFSGSAGVLLLTEKKCILLTDFRYKTQSEIETLNQVEIVIYKKEIETLSNLISSLNIATIAFEKEIVSYAFYESLKDVCNLVPEKGIVEGYRIIKDDEEILQIRKGIEITGEALSALKGNIRCGVSEKEIASELEYLLKKGGAERTAFNVIAASGAHSAMPHKSPSDKRLAFKDSLVIDCGAAYNGYHSDITRTFFVGDKTEKGELIYNIVLKANELAIKSVVPGMKAKDIDKAARDFIAKEGYGEFFGHSTGHGVGLAIHEEPKISTEGEVIIKEGMVFTIEPGIYLENICGVRIEDMVLVTKDGCELLSRNISKEMIILP